MSGSVVESYAGYRYPERPRAFVWEDERIEVEAVERQWYAPAGPVFRVRVAAGRRFTLAYDESVDRWDVQLVQDASEEVI